MQTSRRQLLQVGLSAGAAVALGNAVPGLASPPAKPAVANDNVLVVVQLSGGNDGLNTVIPFRSDEYRRSRPHIAITGGHHRLTEDLALHPSMRAFKDLFDRGQLAIVNGCGYPEPNRSHFRSLEIWHTARPTGTDAQGWLGHYVNHCVPHTSTRKVAAVNVGAQLPLALVAGQTSVPSVQSPADLGLGDATAAAPSLGSLTHETLNAFVSRRQLDQLRSYRADAVYPRGLGQQLQLVARMIAANMGTRVFYCQLGGFDTHANQLPQHHGQLAQLSESIGAFYRDLSAKGYAGKVTTMCFSEFGRRLAQNNSNGTDHGAAGPMFVIGPKVKGGLYGAYPSLTNLDLGDLRYTTDFRRVYATVLENWLGAKSPVVLKNRFEPMAFL